MKSLRLSCIALLALLWAFSANAAHAATIVLSPSAKNVNVGETFSVRIVASSPGQAINAVSGVVSYPRDLLEVTSLSKSGSKISLWVQEPSFSQAAGTVNFEGIILNPGYTGPGATILTISFKARAIGTANVRFTTGAALANDGQGTNVLTGLGSASYAIGVTQIPGPPSGPAPAPVVGAVISSRTHPDQNAWYANDSPVLAWTLPPDTAGISIKMDNAADTVPNAVSQGIFTANSYDHLSDGAWYFHVRVRTASGWQASASHFRVQIDTQKPDRFDVTEITRTDPASHLVSFTFIAHDSGSGIDRYAVQIDGGVSELWKDDGGHVYATSVSAIGTHTLTAVAIDRAGNGLTATSTFTVGSIAPPAFTEVPKELEVNDIMVARGTTFPDSLVTVFLQRNGEAVRTQEVTSDKQGGFVFVANERMRQGSYFLSADVVDARGFRSAPSAKITIPVRAQAFLIVGSLRIGFIGALAIVFLLFLFLLILLLWSRRKSRHWQKDFRKEIIETRDVLHHAFDKLRDAIRTQIKFLESVKSKRDLSLEEQKILKRLKKDLDDAEKMIKKKIEQIGKGI